tara:strand:+ start:208 stop:561 length:354 start_codon:yes stop_codon:yes gene_type:complete
MPILKSQSKQYIFKKKVNISRKTKRELLMESFFMLLISSFLLLINYLIPNKIDLIISFKKNLFAVFVNIYEVIFHTFQILIVLLFCSSILICIFLITGSINRLIKVLLRKSNKFKLR